MDSRFYTKTDTGECIIDFEELETETDQTFTEVVKNNIGRAKVRAADFTITESFLVINILAGDRVHTFDYYRNTKTFRRPLMFAVAELEALGFRLPEAGEEE